MAISLKLANIYAGRGEDDKARAGYRFCMDAQERKMSRGEKKPFTPLGHV